MVKKWILMMLCCGMLNAHEECLKKPLEENVLIMSIPKSGSHLLLKLLRLVTCKEHVNICWEEEAKFFPPRLTWSEDDFTIWVERKAFKPKKVLLTHCHVSDFVAGLLIKKPKTKTLLLVRDLRDVCVSSVFFFQPLIDAQCGMFTTFDQKLMWVLTAGWGEQIDHHCNIRRQAEEMIKWCDRPDVLLLHFEDLVGPKGGGSKKRQLNAIDDVCQFLGIQLTVQEREFVASHLWGGKWTFRKGEVGSWKRYFKPEHIQVFEEEFGLLSRALGY